jgi:hypothetical protein
VKNGAQNNFQQNFVVFFREKKKQDTANKQRPIRKKKRQNIATK